MDAATVQLQPAVYHQNKNVERSMASHPYHGKRPLLTGGVGGHGGEATQGEGGGGGSGKGVLVPIGNVTLFEKIEGGHGGPGGKGVTKGGPGGIGEAPELGNLLIVQENPVAGAAYLSLEDFCKKYHLNTAILKKLQDEGYESAGALFQIPDHDMTDMFNRGQIAEIKRALSEYKAKVAAGKLRA